MSGAASGKRDRRVYLFLFVLTIILGLSSRRFGQALPHFIAAYAGDTLWATMMFFLLAFLFPSRSTRTLAITALSISFAVEFSQMYHAPWLDGIRSTTFGALVLGQGFLWSDLVCYTAGTVLACVVDRLASRQTQLS